MIAIFLALILAAGGTLLTYFYDANSPFLVRCAIGICSGFALFATIAFALSLLIGLNFLSILLTLALFLFLVWRTRAFWNDSVRHDFAIFKSGAPEIGESKRAQRFTRWFLGALLLFVFWAFNGAFYEKADGIYSAYVTNLGDLPLHVNIITNFAWGGNFPPQNPIYSGNLFAYPFLPDFLTAIWVVCGASLRLAFLLQNVALVFALVILLHRFALELVRNRLAALMTPFLVVFCGGLGWMLFIKDASASESGFWTMLAHLPNQYTNVATWRWSNALTTLFITQRSLLLGLPLALTIFLLIWRFISASTASANRDVTGEIESTHRERENASESEIGDASSTRNAARGLYAAGFLASLLPLIHSHSFLTVALICVYCAWAFSPKTRRGFTLLPSRAWRWFFAFLTPITLLEIAYFLIARRSETDADPTAFLAWNFGWDKAHANFFKFWLQNTGALWPLILAVFWFNRESRVALRRFLWFLLPLVILNFVPREGGIFETTWLRVLVALYLMSFPFVVARLWPSSTEISRESDDKNWWRNAAIFWSIATAVGFVMPNLLRFAPWSWDNNKILIYWFVVSVPFAALMLAKMAISSTRWRVAAILIFVSMTAAGAIDAWHGVSAQSEVRIFDRDAMNFAAALRDLPQGTVVLSAPTYNTPLCLAGRVGVIGYPGHLSSHGLNYAARENDVRAFLRGDADSDRVLDLYKVGAFVIGPQERDYLANQQPPLQLPPDEHWKKWKKVAQNGEYSLYKTR